MGSDAGPMPSQPMMITLALGAASAALVQPPSTLTSKVSSSRVGSTAQMGLVSRVKSIFGGKKQDFLEADPYWDQSAVPVNTYKNKSPFLGKIMSVKRIVGPAATGETCHSTSLLDCVITLWR